VDEVMELVELSGIKDTIVGLPGVNGLSTEQIKWLTIPVELVASPSIIFMDEPTSGLASRAAEIVMRTVRNTVNTGRIVVCTIHQPSIDIFEAFDEVLHLHRVNTFFSFICRLLVVYFWVSHHGVGFNEKRKPDHIYSRPLGRNSHKVVEYIEVCDMIFKLLPVSHSFSPLFHLVALSSCCNNDKDTFIPSLIQISVKSIYLI
jgi:hypothetical protein